MQILLLSTLLMTAAATAPAGAPAPDAVHLADKAKRHTLIDKDDNGGLVYVAEGDDDDGDVYKRPKKKRGAKKRSANAGFRYGALPIGGKGVSPQGRPLGIGIQLGFPTALTLKYMLTGDQGIVGGLGFGSLFVPASISLHADYHYHPHVLVIGAPLKLSWYFGGGLWMALSQRENGIGSIIPYADAIDIGSPARLWLAARAPIGVQLDLRQLPLEFYVEAVPALVFFPHLGASIGFTIGARFYF